MRTRRGFCYPRVFEDKNMRVVKRRRDFAAEQVSYRKRSRNSSDIAGKRDLFDSLPDDLVIPILCELSSSATCRSDFANVLLTCRRLNGLGLNFLIQIRQRIVNKILETLKRYFTVSGQEGLHVLRKIAIRFEEKIYTAATSQSDYLRKISLKMLTMETKSQNPLGNALPSNSAGNSNKSPDAASLDSTAQTGHANGADWQEEVYQKIETMKDLYLPEISEMYQKITAKLQLHDSLPQQSKSDQLEKLKVFKTMLERIITFLQVSKNNISPGYKEKLGSYEKQIVNFIIAKFPKKPALQQGQLRAPHMQTMQQPRQLAQIQSYENQMNPQLQSMNLQASLDSTAQRGHANGADWQEEVYQKIETMKDLYLPEISEMYQKIAAKLQPHDSLPQQSKSDQLEKLKVFKTMLERIITFLQVSKNNISPGYNEKLGSYEKQIVNFINTNRPKKPALQRGQLPVPHMQTMQQPPQLAQIQSHENQMNPQLQSMNLQDSTPQTGRANGADWQEEVYQKIKTMKDLYLPEISEMYQKIAAKLQLHDSLPQQSKSDQLEKLKVFKTMLERIITFLQVSKNNISPGYNEKLGSYEKQIVNFINTNRPKKPALQQGQLPVPHMQTMQQPPQLAQIQSLENQMNPQLQSMNLQGSVPTMPQNSMSSLQHNSMSLSGASTAQPNMTNSLQPGSNLDSGQGNCLSSLQPVTMASLQQYPVSTPQQTNINTLSSEWRKCPTA
nr:mediator of RNA polymerase II transcription subunit 15a-like isoform X3 [Quercus suber]